jgi:hypothetical protein
MPRKSSTFVQETRERETWLPAVLEREGADGGDREQLLAAAALTRGALEAIPVPEDAEEKSRVRAIAEMQERLLDRSHQREVRAPWYLRLSRFMRFVFTLGRRR